MKNAAILTTVTQNLANAMQNHGLMNKNYRVLANVVDDVFFKNSERDPDINKLGDLFTVDSIVNYVETKLNAA